MTNMTIEETRKEIETLFERLSKRHLDYFTKRAEEQVKTLGRTVKCEDIHPIVLVYMLMQVADSTNEDWKAVMLFYAAKQLINKDWDYFFPPKASKNP